MLAESVHSFADSGNQGLLLIGRSRSRREETEEHQFGFGSERYFYGFIVAMVVFIVGALFSVLEGIDRIMHPEKLTSPVVALAVLALATVLEGFSFRTAVAESNQGRGPRRWQRLLRFIRRAKAPEVPAVLLEHHPRRPVGRGRLGRDRRRARIRGRDPGHRDEEPADRGVGSR
jgi:hypothetical protein